MRAYSPIPLRSYRRSPRWLVSVLGLLLSLACADAHASTFAVTNLNDSGPDSLRQAITDANANAGADTILFVNGLTGTIALTSALPNLTEDVTLSGPGAKLLTVARSSAAGTPAFRIFTIDAGTATPPTVRISGLTLANGLIATADTASVKYYGGGVLSNKANVTFTDCAISGNSISLPTYTHFEFDLLGYANPPFGYGGGVYNYQGSMTLTRCTVSSNSVTAAGGGGGLGSEGGTLTLTGCTLSGNQVYYDSPGGWFSHSYAYGGGIWNGGTLNLTGCTLANNSTVIHQFISTGADYPPYFHESYSPGSGNSIYNAGTSSTTHINLYQTILASGGNVVNAAGIVLNSRGYNLSNDGTGPNDGTTDRLNVDAKLNPLGDYGGQTLTHIPLPGSPALDAGDPNFNNIPPASDQRGQPRVFNGRVDIGAVERQAVELVAVADAYSVKHDHTLRVAAPGVLTNDTGAAPLSAVLVTQPAHGTLVFNADGSFVYTPNAGYGVGGDGVGGAGDSFTYAVQDGNGRTGNTAAVNLTIIANSPPTLTNSATSTATAGLVWNFTATATDPDLPEDALTFSLDYEHINYEAPVGEVYAPPDMTINATTGVITWTPKTEGTSKFTIKVTDRYGRRSGQLFTLTVALDPNAPVAVNDAYSVKHDQTLTIAAPGVLANDTGTSPLSAILVTQPAHGTVTLNANGSFVYTPTAGYGVATNSMDSFTYRGRDAEGRIGKVATVTITIIANSPPTLTNSLTATATAGKLWSFTATATDPDLPDDALTFALVNAPAGMSINGTTGAITYTPKAESTATFDIKVTDRYGKSDQKTFTLTVQSDPNSPVRLSITDVVVKRVSANTVSVSFNVVNSGTGKATNLVITRATLGGWLAVVTSASVNLGAGGRQAYTLTFKGVTPQRGVVYPLQIRGTYQVQNVAQTLFYGGGVVVP